MVAPSKLIRVVLADDNIDLTAALRRRLSLEPDIDCVGCVSEAREVIAGVTRWEPRVLVLDLSMPGGDTPTMIGELRVVAPDVRTIVFSGYTNDQRIDRSLAAGARRFVCKDISPQNLVDAIRTVAAEPLPTLLHPARLDSDHLYSTT